MSTSLIESNGAAPAVRQTRVVEDHGPVAHLLDTARFEHLQRIAKLLANASLTPAHLIGKSADSTLGNCFQVVNNAIRWGVDPFALAAETYVVGNKLGYQGKLVAALVNSRAGLKQNLRYEYSGSGEQRKVTVIGHIDGEESDRRIELSVAQARTKNEMWTKDPDQKLAYSGATKWARRHCPEVLLGILTDDDLERMVESGAIRESQCATVIPHGRTSARSNLNETLGITHVTAAPGAADFDRGVEPDADDENEQATLTSKQVEELLLECNAHIDACEDSASVERSRQWAITRACGDAGALEAIDTMCEMRLKELTPARTGRPKQGSLVDKHDGVGQ